MPCEWALFGIKMRSHSINGPNSVWTFEGAHVRGVGWGWGYGMPFSSRSKIVTFPINNNLVMNDGLQHLREKKNINNNYIPFPLTGTHCFCGSGVNGAHLLTQMHCETKFLLSYTHCVL